jgi:hypothetical protein
MVVFDSHAPVGGAQAVYMAAVADELADSALARGIETFSLRSVAQGLRVWTLEDMRPPGRFRLYRATVSEAFILDAHDQRISVQLE